MSIFPKIIKILCFLKRKKNRENIESRIQNWWLRRRELDNDLKFSTLTTFFFFDLGASSFTSLTAMSLLDFTNKLLGVIKFAAEMAFDIMSPEAAVVQGKLPHPNISR